MNPIRALLWKEGRAAALRVAACACLALLAARTFPLDPLCHLVGILGAILMSMGLVAGERGRGTLPFQSNLPVRTAWLLGVKYAVGAAGLLAVLAAYWAGIFLGIPHWGGGDFLWSPSWHSYGQLHSMEVLKDVGYGRILLLWFLFSLAFYSGAFLSSTLSNRPFQAAWTSLLMACIGLYLAGIASRVSDLRSCFWWLGLGLDGQILRPAFEPDAAACQGRGSLPAGRLFSGVDLPGLPNAREPSIPVDHDCPLPDMSGCRASAKIRVQLEDRRILGPAGGPPSL